MRPEMIPHGFARVLSLHDHILSAVLPNFTADHFRKDPDVDIFLENILRSRPELLEPSLPSPLRERDIRHALHLTLLDVEDAEDWGEPRFGYRSVILEELEDAWLKDCRFHSRNCQRLFRALAELSHAAGSVPIGSALSDFFMESLEEIADGEDIEDLLGWCQGVRVAFIDARDKEECLRTLLALRPDLLADMQEMGVSWIPMHIVPYSLGQRPRRRGRFRWDDERERRIRRSMEDQELLERIADRDMRRLLALQSRDWSPVRRSRRRDFDYYSRPRSRGLRRSRSPLSLERYRKERLLDDRDRARRLLTARSNDSLVDALRDNVKMIEDLRR